MTNQQLYLAIGIPSILILLTWLTNFIQISWLRTETSNLRTEMATELRAIRSDINTLTRMYGEHGERLVSLEAGKKGQN